MKTIRVLFTASGRRVSLLRFFRLSGKRLGIPVELHAADRDGTAPTLEIADRTHFVPSAGSPEFVSAIEKLCNQYRIDLIVSLIDPELPILAAARAQIERTGATLSLPDLATVEIAADKVRTYEHFAAEGITTARTWDVEDGKLPTDAEFPLVIKPRCGSGTVDVVTVRDAEQFDYFVRRIEQPCAQELLTGQEYTFDILVGTNQRPLCIVPRLRVQTRAGETSRGITVMNLELIDAARRVVESLPGARGPMNIQAFREGDGPIVFTEINARFGGGYVLSYHAGADFPAAMLLEQTNRGMPAEVLQPRPDVVLLRYDDELITDLATLRSRGYEPPW